MSDSSSTPDQGLVTRLFTYLLQNKPDLLFALLRNLRPNLVLKSSGTVFITRYADVIEALSSPDVFNVTYAPMMDPVVGPFMLARDLTEINQRDKGIMRAFMRREDLPRITEMAAQFTATAIDAQRAKGKQIEVVASLSRGVPVDITEAYFGVTGPDRAAVLRWSRATQYDMFHNLNNDPAIHQDNLAAGAEMRARVQTLLDTKRQQIENGEQHDDVFSRLVRASFPDEIGFDDARVMTNMMGTLVGGIETTSQAVVQILDQFFRRPDILEEAIALARDANDEKLARYCWEALRFNPINPFVVRRCASDYTIAAGTLRAVTISAGDTVCISTRSAMADGRKLEMPRTFVTDRPEYSYLHYGYGLHGCLGDQVASAQIPQIVKGILQLPGVRPVSDIDFKNGPFPEEYRLEFD